MNRVLNFGSLNIDHVYQLERFLRPGETRPCLSYQRFAGGKGFNQSIAMARAGIEVMHVGCIGSDGLWLRDRLVAEGVNVTHLHEVPEVATGHAIIQVTPEGENAILIEGGANRTLDLSRVEATFDSLGEIDLVVMQNETNAVPAVFSLAKSRGIPLAFNPAPMTSHVTDLPLAELAVLIVNEVEAAELVGTHAPDKLCDLFVDRYPETLCVVTAGAHGSLAAQGRHRWRHPVRSVQAVDTTGAGDTFIGYFLYEWLRSGSVDDALATGNGAAAISVTRPGAAESIPRWEEVAAHSST